MEKGNFLIKVLSITTFTLATVTIASIFYEGLILKWLDYVGVSILLTDIAFLLTTIAGLFYYKKHNLLFFCHLFSIIIIAIAIIIAIFKIEFSKWLFLLWEFYILYFYGIIIAKKWWNYKKSDR
jgi:phosphatidylserine synthase